jgi:hypothetical protein
VNWLNRLRGTDPAGARGQAAKLVDEATALSGAGRHAEAVTAGEQAVRLLRAQPAVSGRQAGEAAALRSEAAALIGENEGEA